MLGTFGEVYVLDWGVAKITADDPSTQFDTGPHKPATTAAGTMTGTLGYMRQIVPHALASTGAHRPMP